MRKLLFLIGLVYSINIQMAVASPPWTAEIKPKYGPEATPLSVSHEFFQKHPSPTFWVLIPYYIPQQGGAACSLASITMIVNAARVGQFLNSEQKLATQTDLLKKVKNPAWKSLLGKLLKGVTLRQLGSLAEDSLKAYGVKPQEVKVVHTPDLSESTRKELHDALLQTEKSARTLILANFNQATYTGDAEVGHIAPIGAYDTESKKVLILDPDREWYEPYWVSEETLLKGMATPDKQSGKNRGYVVISLPEHQ